MRLEAARRIEQLRGRPARAFAGLDGFIDEIVHLVRQRQDAEHFERIETISELAEKLAGYAGKSGNVEGVARTTKMGGNGPLMSSAMGSLGVRIFYAGAVGVPEVHPVFAKLLEFGEVLSIADPAHTDALEFADGKIMLGKMESLREVTWERIVQASGGEEAFAQKLDGCRLAALTNWTMLPEATDVFDNLMRVAAGLDQPPMFFFDLADPAKRRREDLKAVLELLGRHSADGRYVMLGLNHNEALQVAETLQCSTGASEEPAALCELADAIRRASGVTEIIVHPRPRAAASTAERTVCVEGTFTRNPKISTGAGDHFNGGYAYARLLELDIELALIVGQAVAGFYIRNGASPSPEDVIRFCEKWAEAGGNFPEI